MDLRIIVVLAALFGLIYIFKVKNRFARIITGAGVISIGISLIPIPAIAIDGFYIFFAFHVGAIIYALSYDEFSNEKKIVLSTVAVFSALPATLYFTPYAAQVWVGLLSIIPIFVFGYGLKNKVQDYKNEIGFLIIMVGNALVTFIGTVQIYWLA